MGPRTGARSWPLVAGILVVGAASILLWPIMLPAVGAGLVAGGAVSRRGSEDARTRVLATVAIALGIVLIAVMLAFYALSLGVGVGGDFREVPSLL